MADNVLDLIPAYGRFYEDEESLQKDWEGGKDFMILAGPYCSIRDLKLMKERGYRALVIRNHPVVKQFKFAKIIVL